MIFGKLREPLHERIRTPFEILVIVLREIAEIDGFTPLDRARVGLFLAREHVVEHGDGSRFIAHDADFVAFLHGETDIFEVALFRQPFDAENVVADFALKLEVDEGILREVA